MTVLPFNTPKNHAVDLIRKTAQDSSNVVLPFDSTMGEWQRITTDRQIIACIKQGELIRGPMTDTHGNTECIFERYTAGICIWVTVSLYKKENRWMIYVTRIEKQS